MKIFEHNPFRVLGVISNSSLAQIHESEKRIKRFLEVGKSATLVFDITPPLNKINRTKELIFEAKNKLHSDTDKLFHSIFWFIDNSVVDKIALENLTKEKNSEKALENFKKGCRDFNITNSSCSSVINFTTLDMIAFNEHNDISRLKNSIKLKFEVLNNQKAFTHLEEVITGREGKINSSDVINLYFKSIKSYLVELFPNKEKLYLYKEFLSFDEANLKIYQQEIIDDITSNLNSLIEDFDNQFELLKERSSNNIQFTKDKFLKNANRLIIDSRAQIVALKKITIDNNYIYTKAINNIYERVNYSVIFPYNKEFEVLNNYISSGKRYKINEVNLNPYINLLHLAYKNIESIDCQIKSTILSNLDIIRKNNSDLQEIKSRELVGSTDTFQTKSEDENYATLGGIIGGIVGVILILNAWNVKAIIGAIIIGLIGRAVGSQIKKQI